MRFTRLILALLSGALLNACAVPDMHVYYRPSVDIESSHEQGHCVPLEKYVNFTLPSASGPLNVRGYGNTYATGTEAQYVISGRWHSITFRHEQFTLLDPATGERIVATSTWADQNTSEIHSTAASPYYMFNTGATFPKQKASAFDVYFPPLIVNGEVIHLPVLHVKKTIWTGLSPFNC